MISRYILKEFFRAFLTALGGITVVYLCVEFLQKADDFIRHKATISQVAWYFFYSMPSLFTPSIPIASLVAALLSLGALSRHSEVIAMRAAGISLGRVAFPVIAGGALISVFGFVNNEMIVPAYSAKANYIRNVEIEKKEQRVVFRQQKLWLRGPDNSIANIDFISPDRDVMLGLNIFKLNDDYTVRERIRAGRLLWENDAWRFKESTKYIRSGEKVITKSADNEIYNVVDNPGNLGMIVKRSEEMRFMELWEYVRRLKTSGYNAVRYEVELYDKISFPVSSLLMVVIAAPLGLYRVRGGGPGKGMALAVLIAFLYWSLLSVGTALGRSGTLPPLAASWMANVVFLVYGGIGLIRLQRNS